VVAFGTSFGLLFGGLAWRYRGSVRPVFARLGLDNFAGFLLLSVLVSAAEETWCRAPGNRVAYPVLWKDIAFCTGVWLAWYSTWYIFIARRFAFREKEALLLAAVIGVFYEFVGNGAFLASPAGILMALPLSTVIYASLFLLPMQLIDFSGRGATGWRLLIGPVLPYLLSWPAALLLAGVL